MSYSGPSPVTQSFVAGTDYFTGDGATNLFTLSRRVGSPDDLLISVNGNELDPRNYSLYNSNTLTFATAPLLNQLIVVRYMTTVLWQTVGDEVSGSQYYYELRDVLSNFSYGLTALTVGTIASTTNLVLSGVSGLSVGSVISSTILPFTGQVISAIVGNTVTVSSTASWGTTTTIASNKVYLWNTPLDNTLPVYDTGTQKWVNSTAQAVFTNANVAIGNQTLYNVPAASINNVALGNNTLKALSTSAGVTGSNHLAIGDGAGSLIQTSTNNAIFGKYSGNSGGMDIRQTGVYGTPAIFILTVAAGTTANAPSMLTITFGTATSFFPASVTTVALAANSTLATVITALTTALSLDSTISAAWTITATATGVTLAQITPNVVGFPLTAFAFAWSTAPTSGLTVTKTEVEALSYPTSGNVVIADQLSNIRAVCTANNRWGFGTVLPLANLHVQGSLRIQTAFENAIIVTTPLTGLYGHDLNVGGVTFFTAEATGNFQFSFVWGGSSVNAMMPVNHSLTVAFITTQGATAYYMAFPIQIDGASVTPKWLGSAAPSQGNASGYDVYVFTIFKTAPATYSVTASLTQYGG